MATFGGTLRRGLPRTPGGEPWPPAGAAPGGSAAARAAEAAAAPPSGATAVVDAPADQGSVGRVAAPVAVDSAAEATPDVAAQATSSASGSATAGRSVRRGLPRVPGGEPWPPASMIPTEVAAVVATERVAAPQASPSTAGAAGGKALRRGLPRTPGGEPWPPAGLAPSVPAAAATDATPGVVADAPAVPAAEAPASTARGVVDVATAVPAAEIAASVAPAVGTTPSGVPLSQPLPYAHTVWEGANARVHPVRREPRRIGPLSGRQWGLLILGGAALLYAAAMAVLAVRWLLSTSWGVDFLAAFPGEYHLPEGAPVGFPAWLGWQHFFNVFLMVLIIRTGLTVRTEKRPTVFWSPRNNGKRKISLNLWFHQSLDILWLVNGVLFVVLLFVTGQWLRIVPTSWEVFPNALSAALQYVSLDWPTENGWVNYNSLQQLAYFATVFIAAPLAALTGVRMSGIWPKNAAGLNKAYPVEWARAVHFPVMLYFVLFIFVHVVLVFATGALRNLNHMYGGQDAINWVGFWIFALSMLVIAAAWVAARPLVLAPIARLFGKVSGR